MSNAKTVMNLWITEDEARQCSTEDTKEHEDRERDAWGRHNAGYKLRPLIKKKNVPDQTASA